MNNVMNNVMTNGYDKFYVTMTVDEMCNKFELDKDSINDSINYFKEKGYGDVVGVLVAKEEYAWELGNDDKDILYVFNDSTVRDGCEREIILTTTQNREIILTTIQNIVK